MAKSYILEATNGKQTGFYTGPTFDSDRAKAKTYDTRAQADTDRRRLKMPEGWEIKIVPADAVLTTRNPKRRRRAKITTRRGFDNCVRDVKRKGGAKNARAVCQSQVNKTRRNPVTDPLERARKLFRSFT